MADANKCKRGVVFKVTWPNGKIFIAYDATDSISFFGSPDNALIARDFPTCEARQKMTVQREILLECENVTRGDLARIANRFIADFNSKYR